MNKMIFVTFQKEGIHKYPDALTNPALESVSFLANSHRHMFHFKVWISVGHADRDIEFIIFKRWLESLYGNGVLELNFKSCEMMIEDLHLQINKEYPNREIWIEISEDGENGAFYQYDKILQT